MPQPDNTVHGNNQWSIAGAKRAARVSVDGSSASAFHDVIVRSLFPELSQYLAVRGTVGISSRRRSVFNKESHVLGKTRQQR